MRVDLQQVTLGVALGEVWNDVREIGGNNDGPKIREYLANLNPPIRIPAAWCAAFVQGCSDYAARNLGMTNPLDAVEREALVQDYYEWAAPQRLVNPVDARPGDLVLFDFRGIRWDHIGILLQPVTDTGQFWTVEGNTSPGVGATDAERERDGDEVAIKIRTLSIGKRTPIFVRWA